MGCCGSKGGAAGAEARDARRERERERRRANGADDEDEDDAVSSSRARVHAWQMEAEIATFLRPLLAKASLRLDGYSKGFNNRSRPPIKRSPPFPTSFPTA